MKNIDRKWFFFVMSLLLLAFVKVNAGAGTACDHPVAYSYDFAPDSSVISFTENGSPVMQHVSSEVAAQSRVHVKLERKKRLRFIHRVNCGSQSIRKESGKVYNFHYDLAIDPGHAAAPDENWPIRPRYYIFLFRLSPF